MHAVMVMHKGAYMVS